MNKGYVGVAAALAFFLLALLVPGPSISHPAPTMQGMQMDVAPGHVIDGSKHPEAITDKAAYQAYFNQVSHFDYDGRSLALSRFQFTNDEFAVVSVVLDNFAASFDAENAAFDAIGNAGLYPTNQQEQAHRKALRDITQTAVTGFVLGLGDDRSKQLNAVLQFEKKGMAIDVEDTDEDN